MNAMTLPTRAPVRGIVAELLVRQRALTIFGTIMLALALPALAAQGIDARTLGGVNVWVKPVKFLVSIGVYALTLAWFYGYADPAWRTSRAARWTAATVIATGVFEIVWIAIQAARGRASHFNYSTELEGVMYGAMGVGASIFLLMSLPLAWAIARRPAAGLGRDMQAALVAGLVLSVILGGWFGWFMGGAGSHAVGAEGGGMALLGWNRLGGDMRVAHFLGLHIAQALPFAAFLLAGRNVVVRRAGLVMVGGLWVAASVAVFVQALAGRALVPLV